MCALFSFVSCQISNNFGSSFGGTPGIAANSGVQGGNFNSYAQNTQAYSNQISAVNYSPFASFNSYAQTPANWGNSYGSSFVNPYVAAVPYYGYAAPVYGGYGCYPRWC